MRKMEHLSSSSSTQMTLSEKKTKLEGLRAHIVSIDSDLLEIQTKLDRVYKEKLLLEKEKMKLETEAAHLEQACKLPDVDLKRSDFQWSKKLHELKKSKFNIREFRSYQEEVINATMSKRDVILVMPTGGGKSLCFQLPALLCNGFTLVISPLVSLMEDQAMALKDCGIAAVNLSASTSKEEVKVVHQDMIRQNTALKLLYVTPEKIAKSKRFMAQLQKAYEKGLLARIAIDEVHCCSQWGHDFRPDYKVLGILKRQFSDSPIIGLTATASASVLEDVKEILNIPACEVFRASYNRANLFYEVRPKPPGKEFTNLLVKMLQEEFINQSGIIYCFSRKETETLANDLVSRGIMAAPYHAYMEPEERSATHRNWKGGHLQVVVATTAFGMGIDKPDVRFVIHHSLSKSMENYYQESGRAGRDGKEAKCILFFSFVDVFRQSTMVVMEQTGLSKLYQMVAYCISEQRCRKTLLAEHFDEKWGEGVNCNRMCDACSIQATVKEVDVSHIMKAIYDILRESSFKDQRLTGLKLVDQLVKSEKQRGSSKLSKDQYCSVILHLLLEGFLKEDFHFTPYNTISYICPGPKAGHLSSKIMIPMRTQSSSKKRPSKVKVVKGQASSRPDEDVIILDDEDGLSPGTEESTPKWNKEGDILSGEEKVKSMSDTHVVREPFSSQLKVTGHKSDVKGHSLGKKNLTGCKKSYSRDIVSPKDETLCQGEEEYANVSRRGSKVNLNVNEQKSFGVRSQNVIGQMGNIDRTEISVLKDECLLENDKAQSRHVEVDSKRTSKMGESKVKGSIKRKAIAEVIDLSDGSSHELKKRMKNSKGILEKTHSNVLSFAMSPQTRSLPEKRKLDSHQQSRSSTKTSPANHQNANLHYPSSSGNWKDNSVGSNLSVSGQKAIKAGEMWLQKSDRQVVKENYSRRMQEYGRKASKISNDGEEKSGRRSVSKKRNIVSVSLKPKESTGLGEQMLKNSPVESDTSMNSSVSESDLESIYLEQLSTLEKTDAELKNQGYLDNTLNTERSLLFDKMSEMDRPSTKSCKLERKALVKERCRLNDKKTSHHRKCDSRAQSAGGGFHYTDAFGESSLEVKKVKMGDGDDCVDGKDLSTDGSELEELATVYSEQLSSLEQKGSEDGGNW